jgi:16S rRNA (uracil1498-N3)-methyltransferase
MPRHDFTAPRLFVRTPLAAGARIDLDRGQANYLTNVLRLGAGDTILVFNGSDGEWLAHLEQEGRRRSYLIVELTTRGQTPPSDLDYIFAPLKQARLDYMVQKAVEMGAGRLRPVATQHTQVRKINRERLEANAIEAAEQCGILSLPQIDDLVPLDRLLNDWDPSRHLVFCDEGEESADPVAILAALKPPGPLAVLVGPEGGFSEGERRALRALDFVTALPLGPRILRTDTAAIAALALVQAVAGDWRPKT